MIRRAYYAGPLSHSVTVSASMSLLLWPDTEVGSALLQEKQRVPPRCLDLRSVELDRLRRTRAGQWEIEESIGQSMNGKTQVACLS